MGEDLRPFERERGDDSEPGAPIRLEDLSKRVEQIRQRLAVIIGGLANPIDNKPSVEEVYDTGSGDVLLESDIQEFEESEEQARLHQVKQFIRAVRICAQAISRLKNDQKGSNVVPALLEQLGSLRDRWMDFGLEFSENGGKSSKGLPDEMKFGESYQPLFDELRRILDEATTYLQANNFPKSDQERENEAISKSLKRGGRRHSAK